MPSKQFMELKLLIRKYTEICEKHRVADATDNQYIIVNLKEMEELLAWLEAYTSIDLMIKNCEVYKNGEEGIVPKTDVPAEDHRTGETANS